LASQLESSFELIQRAQQGDEDALNRLLDRYHPRLRRWASGRLPAHARELGDTNDLVQEAIIGTFRRLDRLELRGEGALQAYLRQAVMNRIVDEVRRVERRPRRDEFDTDASDGCLSPLQLAIGNQAIELYEKALKSLTDTERQAVIARIELGHTYEEVAALVGKPTAGAARVAVSRALTKIATLMAAARQVREAASEKRESSP
jgi:RNA polymerase sigma-70 factor (ECF subfamily)